VAVQRLLEPVRDDNVDLRLCAGQIALELQKVLLRRAWAEGRPLHEGMLAEVVLDLLQREVIEVGPALSSGQEF
jgi:hypothetical protein